MAKTFPLPPPPPPPTSTPPSKRRSRSGRQSNKSLGGVGIGIGGGVGVGVGVGSGGHQQAQNRESHQQPQPQHQQQQHQQQQQWNHSLPSTPLRSGSGAGATKTTMMTTTTNTHTNVSMALSDEVSTTKSGGGGGGGGIASWAHRIPWIRQNKSMSRSYDGMDETDGVYREYGEVMKQFGMASGSPIHHTVSAEQESHAQLSRTASISESSLDRRERAASASAAETALISPFSTSYRMPKPNATANATSAEDDETEDSLADFKDSEWTPQDSAYGAACPICGCLPKQIRRGIEVTLIAFIVVLLVYVCVRTSIRVSNESDGGAHNVSSGGNVNLDDDFFIENAYYNDDVYGADDAHDDDSYYPYDDDAENIVAKTDDDSYYTGDDNARLR